MAFKAGKTYKIRNGGEARVLEVVQQEKEPLIGMYRSSLTGLWNPAGWQLSGRFLFDPQSEDKAYCQTLLDLLPEKVKAWANLYLEGGGAFRVFGSLHPTREAADSKATTDRVACVEFEVDEDELE